MSALSLGMVIRRLREEADLTQAELERRAGLGSSTISDIERDVNDPRDATLEAIAVKGLGMTYAAFQLRRYVLQWGVSLDGGPSIDPYIRQLAEELAALPRSGRLAIEAMLMALKQARRLPPE